jgi:hypothetical protein
LPKKAALYTIPFPSKQCLTGTRDGLPREPTHLH